MTPAILTVRSEIQDDMKAGCTGPRFMQLKALLDIPETKILHKDKKSTTAAMHLWYWLTGKYDDFIYKLEQSPETVERSCVYELLNLISDRIKKNLGRETAIALTGTTVSDAGGITGDKFNEITRASTEVLEGATWGLDSGYMELVSPDDIENRIVVDVQEGGQVRAEAGDVPPAAKGTPGGVTAVAAAPGKVGDDTVRKTVSNLGPGWKQIKAGLSYYLESGDTETGNKTLHIAFPSGAGIIDKDGYGIEINGQTNVLTTIPSEDKYAVLTDYQEKPFKHVTRLTETTIGGSPPLTIEGLKGHKEAFILSFPQQGETWHLPSAWAPDAAAGQSQNPAASGPGAGAGADKPKTPPAQKPGTVAPKPSPPPPPAKPVAGTVTDTPPHRKRGTPWNH